MHSQILAVTELLVGAHLITGLACTTHPQWRVNWRYNRVVYSIYIGNTICPESDRVLHLHSEHPGIVVSVVPYIFLRCVSIYLKPKVDAPPAEATRRTTTTKQST